jgi:hypothetical protein
MINHRAQRKIAKSITIRQLAVGDRFYYVKSVDCPENHCELIEIELRKSKYKIFRYIFNGKVYVGSPGDRVYLLPST